MELPHRLPGWAISFLRMDKLYCPTTTNSPAIQLVKHSFLANSGRSGLLAVTMAGPSNKRAHRDNFRSSTAKNGVVQLPRKRFYRQRAHANPFSDHQLI